MNRHITQILLLLTTLLVACDSSSNHVSIGARFLNINQATFYLYSPDGLIQGFDTVQVNGGRFEYERQIDQEGTLVLLFPNFAQMPIFVKPGASITINADASKLRSMDITGTDENKQYTEWRKNTAQLSTKKVQTQAERFIRDNPTSIISLWLLRQHFILAEQPDISKARELVRLMQQSVQKDGSETMRRLVTRLAMQLSRVTDVTVGQPLPRFIAHDIDGKAITNGQLLKGNTVVVAWASWNEDSKQTLRVLASSRRNAKDSLQLPHVLTVCLDPDVKLCRATLKKCMAESLTTVCDTMMWESPVVRDLGITALPWNIKVSNGKIIGRGMTNKELTAETQKK